MRREGLHWSHWPCPISLIHVMTRAAFLEMPPTSCARTTLASINQVDSNPIGVAECGVGRQHGSLEQIEHGSRGCCSILHIPASGPGDAHFPLRYLPQLHRYPCSCLCSASSHLVAESLDHGPWGSTCPVCPACPATDSAPTGPPVLQLPAGAGP